MREVSLFKFMTVLKVEVWFSILAALVSTAIMIWFLDKYSPYSARNNKDLYPYPCRYFKKFLLPLFAIKIGAILIVTQF